MADNEYEYPYADDRFDIEADEVGAHGGHRAEEPFVKRNLGALLTILAAILVVLLAFWVFSSLSNNDSEPATTQTVVSDGGGASDNTTSTDAAPSDGGGETQASAEEETEEPAPAADRTRPVLVLNGAGISGLAAEWSSALNAEGWTSVDVGNVQRTETPGVYYRNAEDQATAQELADYLGVQAEQSERFQSSIVIVIVESPGDLSAGN